MAEPIPLRFKTGERLSAAKMNALSRQATAVYRMTTSGGRAQLLPGKVHLSMGDDTWEFPMPATRMSARNIDAQTLVPFDVCQITLPRQVQDYDSFDFHGTPIESRDKPNAPEPTDVIGRDRFVKTQTVAEVCVPRVSGFGRWAVVAEPTGIVQDQVGEVWVDGVVLCKLMYPEIFEPEIPAEPFVWPDRCDTMADQIYLQAEKMGSGQILWIARAADYVGDTPRLALVRIDHRQTTPISIARAEDDEDQEPGAAEVIILPPEWRVVSAHGHGDPRLSHGIVKIEKVPVS